MNANSQTVPSGYKLTEVGVIPDEWDAPQLGNILKSTQLGGNYKNSERETSWPLIKMGNLGRGSINLAKLEFVERSQPPSSKDRLRRDDVLFNTRNTLDLVGKVALWRDELPEAYFNSNIMRMEFDDAFVSSNRFMNYILNTPRSLRSLRGIAIGTTSVAAIYGRDLVKVPVPLPTIAEQEAIAEALGDVDAWIESLEQLVVKKRHLKQAAMQQLLTGKKRLPGFNGKWNTMHFRDLLSYERPDKYIVRDVEYLEHGDVPVLTANKAFILGYTREDFGVCSNIPAIVFDDFTTDSKYADFPFKVKSSAIKLLRPKRERVDLRFVFDRMQLIRFPLGDHKRYYISEYQNQDLLAPQYEEQCAIAEVLRNMEAEIAAINAKLAKARQIKHGMMQELLTGRTRLV